MAFRQSQISVTAACSSTPRMSRPTKKIGCLGSSSNMTHRCRRSYDTGHEVDRETDRHLMKFVEEEMRTKRSNSKVSPLSKTRSSDKAEFQENRPHVVKSLGQSMVTGISLLPRNELERSSLCLQHNHDKRLHKRETQHQLPSTETPQKTLPGCRNGFPPSSFVIDTGG